MIEIRRMTADDVKDVSELEKIIFSTPWSEESFSRAIDNQDNVYLIAREDETGEIAGYCGIWMVAGEGQINNVAVSEKFRNAKIATKMLKMAMRMCQIHSCEDFTLEVRRSNAPAIRVYEKLGLKECGVRKDYYKNPKEDAIIMWRHPVKSI